jgi:hypothetical protein
MVVSGIELCGVAAQMSLANPVLCADDAALEDGQIVFDRVCMPESGADIFLRAVVDRAVAAELATMAG